MQLDPGSEKPIFIQLAETIEDSILKGIYSEESQIPSTTELSLTLKINPATANRGVNLLVDEGIVYKKRGMGMFVSSGGLQKILVRRRQAFYKDYLLPLLKEAENLGLSREDLIGLIKQPVENETIERG